MKHLRKNATVVVVPPAPLTVARPADHLRALVTVHPADATVAPAARAGVAVALALAVPALLGRADLAAFASLAALASLYGRYDALRRRAVVVAVAGAVLSGAMLLTTALEVVGAPLLVAAGAVALVAGAAHAAAQLTRVGPPGAVIVVFAAGAGLAGAPTAADLLPRAAACVVGVAIAWLVACSGWLTRPTAPGRLAVRRAGVAVARAVRTGSPADHAAARNALGAARALLAHDAAGGRTRDHALALTSTVRVLEADLGGPVGPEHPGPPARLRDHVRAGWPAAGWRLPAVRVTAAGVVASVVAVTAGLGHPAWAVMGSTATLQGSDRRHVVVRGVQRAVGTVLGAGLAWPLLTADLPFWAVAALVCVLQTVTEVLVGRHYGLAMLTITPMALLMTSLAGGTDPGALALDRALDTVLGAAVAVVVLLALPHRDAPARR